MADRVAKADVPIGVGNAFALVLRNRYLLLMALVIFLLNWVNTSGEYILSVDREACGRRRGRGRDALGGRTRVGSSACSSPITSRS